MSEDREMVRGSSNSLLLVEFGESYSERNLRNYRQFYRLFPDFEIWNARVPNLTCACLRGLSSQWRELQGQVGDGAEI